MKSKLTKVVSLVMAVAIIVSLAMPFASAAKKQTNFGLCSSPVTGNADNASFPATLGQVKVGKTYYFNFQVDSSQKVKWVEVSFWYHKHDWLIYPRGYCEVVTKRDTAQNYMRYTSFKHKILSGYAGDSLLYYFQVKYTNGLTQRFPSNGCYSVTVK